MFELLNEMEAGLEPVRKIESHNQKVRASVVSADGRFLFFGDRAGEVRKWDTRKLKFVPSWKSNTTNSVLHALCASSENLFIFSGGDDAVIRMWKQSTGKVIRTFETKHTDWIESLAETADGRYIFSASSDHTIIQWEVTCSSI